MQVTEVYSKKIDSAIKAIHLIGCNVNDIVDKYDKENFPNGGPLKSTCFLEVINKKLSYEIYEYVEKICSLAHHRDSRKAYEYGIDLILGWLIEDAVLIFLEDSGKKAILSGQDRYRKFLSARKISTQPDICIQLSSGNRMLEVFSDWKGTWRNQNHADLRDNKYNKLKEKKAILLGIAPLSGEGFLIDISQDDKSFVENFIPAYRKMGFTHNAIRSELRSLDLVMNDLLSI
ncbi:MAG: hypothetical protein CMI58_06225 [Parcubacteria group bacterium]|nr:hypothetical protein [Parcubacteria group bacterium]|tara:strand:+ start:2598 stop:3293 length:696 start_codon:yes stop_codon:yes gene_type:complete